jgi:peptide/nickel transport system ATP-binding protein
MTTLMPSTHPGGGSDQLLVVEDLSVQFPTADGLVHAVTGLSYTLEQGKTLGIVGESGSGKSVSSMAVLGLHDPNSTRVAGSIRVLGEEVVGADLGTLRRLRGNAVAMIFQDALAALHPFKRVGKQLSEAYLVHHPQSTKREARRRAVQMLDRVGIPQPDTRVDDFPHQFSGGMRQRVMIAMGLINDPSLLIADEPTTALDVTVQAQILDLLQDLQREFNSGIVFITHDLGVIAELADDVLVMYAGRAVEYGSAEQLFNEPEHPYAWGLLGSMPRFDKPPTERLLPIKGVPPSLIKVPPGCPFNPRCEYQERVGSPCLHDRPELLDNGRDHRVACHIPSAERRTIWAQEITPRLQ